MPTMGPVQQQVYIDVVLGQISIAYQNENYIADTIFPQLMVQKRTGIYFVYDKSKFRQVNDYRAPRTRAQQVEYGLTQASYGPLLEHALEQAQLTAFIQQLPRGLATWVGEQGLRLSGGERQRLAIARALLKDAPLLVLDEATANLDPMTEHTLLDALDMLMQGRTTLVITHRLVRMERMDEILVLDEGSIRERGTHEQLLRSGGLYQQMVQLQEGILSLT